MHVTVVPNPVAADAPFAVRISGLAPNQLVTVTARVIDDANLTWTAKALFEAVIDGTVDLATQAPRTGTYTVLDPMGLVWSLMPTGVPTNTWNYASVLQLPPLKITAEGGGNISASIDVVRQLATPAITSVDVVEDGIRGRFFRPSNDEPCPAVLVLGGSEGGLSPYILREGALLATHGFAALALAYFSYDSLPPLLERIPLEYFGDAMSWLLARPGIHGDRLGVIGHSRGAELALLLGTYYSQITAVVSYAGGGLVYPSPSDHTIPAWTWHGAPVPDFLDKSNWNDSEIPVERINGPILLFSGDADIVWPSTLLSELALDRLIARRHPFADEHYSYSGAGHDILAPYIPTGIGRNLFGGDAASTAAADADSWPRVLKLLNQHLRR
ncbi:MAG: acyl-CoA thioesterase/bile acid-CoA:amino acid N-acyltransferase family protein [Thermomicrobiales bacterium]